MKKQKIFLLMLVTLMSASLLMSSCGKAGGGSGTKKPEEPQTLEQYAVSNPSVQQSIDEAMKNSDVEVGISGNDVIYTYELSKMEGYTEDVATDPEVIEAQQKVLDGSAATFGGIAKSLESATGISGIRVTVNYTFNGEVLVTRTFDSSDAVSEGETAEPSDEEGEAGEEGASEEDGSDSENE